MGRAAVFGAVFVAGAVGLAVLALVRDTGLVYSVGVKPALVAVEVEPGSRACQKPVRPPRGESFDRVGFLTGTFGRPGPELRVEVLEDGTGRRLAAGTLPSGYPDLDADRREQVVRVGRVRSAVPLRICLANRGSRRVALIGQAAIASPTTEATLDGEVIATDLTINLREESRSLLAAAPDMAERAARFRAGWVGPLVYGVLGLVLVAGAPVLLARGLSRAAADDAL